MFSSCEGLPADEESHTERENCHRDAVSMRILKTNTVLYCTKLHIVNRCAIIVCLGCFIKALKVSSSLYRDLKGKKIFFFYKNTRVPHTNTHHAFTSSSSSFFFYVSARLCNCKKHAASVGLFRGDASFVFTEAAIQCVDNKRFDCLNKTSTHLKLSQFTRRALHSWALSVCISNTLVNWCSGALTLLLLVCEYTPRWSLLWQCTCTLVCAFIGFGQQMACHG